jgi:4-amino-4-deoxy-L-arabinose transferase-like glycosyltransferase
MITGLASRDRADRVTIVAASLAVNLTLVARTGIVFGADSSRYLGAAERLLSGGGLQGVERAYLGYIAVVAASRWLGTGLPGVVALQFAVAAAAALALYALGKRIAGRESGILAAALFVLDPDIARWHSYVLTDSLFLSAVVLTTWLALAAADLGGWRYIAAGVFTLLAALLRTNGWPVVAVVAIFWIVRSSSPSAGRWGAVGLILASLAAAPILRPAPAGYGPHGETPRTWLRDWLRDGVVTWGYAPWQVRMPSDFPSAESGWADLLSFVGRHPLACAKLAAARLAAELAHVRPFYSAFHNAAIALFLLLLYPLAISGLVRWRSLPITQLAAGIVSSQLAVVALTFSDWDGRFLLYFLPLLGMLAAADAVTRVRHLRAQSR